VGTVTLQLGEPLTYQGMECVGCGADRVNLKRPSATTAHRANTWKAYALLTQPCFLYNSPAVMNDTHAVNIAYECSRH